MGGTLGSISGGAIPLSQFVTMFLAPRLGRPVVDRTELQGNFDLHLTFRPDFEIPPDTPAALTAGVDPNGPALMTALQEQLGLKVESIKGSADVLVIDHIERPTPD
jgi:uncharacterized protein (TIGR03435 family)